MHARTCCHRQIRAFRRPGRPWHGWPCGLGKTRRPVSDRPARVLKSLASRATSTPARRNLPARDDPPAPAGRAGPRGNGQESYHRFSSASLDKDMNDYSRTARVLVVEDDEDIAQALQR